MSGPRRCCVPVLDMTPTLERAVFRRVATSQSERKDFIMSRPTATAAAQLKTPAFQAWHVVNKGENAFWTKVGAAWPHRDGKGLSLQLSVIPISSQIVLREPVPKQ
jgi:hypothetical protein